MNPVEKMMLGIAIGDTFAKAYEFVPEIHINWKQYSAHSGVTHKGKTFRTSPAGIFTDDTQMSLGVAQLILAGEEATKENFAKYFLKNFKAFPITGYAGGFQKFLEATNTAKEFVDNIRPQSIRNGAAMRALPIGALPDIKEVMRYAHVNAQLTHNTPEGILSSQAMALAAHHQLHEIAVPLDYFLEAKLRHQFPKEKPNKWVACDAVQTIDAVVGLFKHATTAKQILEDSILLGGDTDSVAALALGLYMIRKGNLEELPTFLYEDIYNGKVQGREHIQQLGRELGEKYEIK